MMYIRELRKAGPGPLDTTPFLAVFVRLADAELAASLFGGPAAASVPEAVLETEVSRRPWRTGTKCPWNLYSADGCRVGHVDSGEHGALICDGVNAVAEAPEAAGNVVYGPDPYDGRDEIVVGRPLSHPRWPFRIRIDPSVPPGEIRLVKRPEGPTKRKPGGCAPWAG